MRNEKQALRSIMVSPSRGGLGGSLPPKLACSPPVPQQMACPCPMSPLPRLFLPQNSDFVIFMKFFVILAKLCPPTPPPVDLIWETLSNMINIRKNRRCYTQKEQCRCSEMGNEKQQLLLKSLINQEVIKSKRKWEFV